MEFSLFYFDGDGTLPQPDKYKLLIESAKFGDRNNFTAIWTPERHFHAFGGLYPNPALTSAAIATITEKIQLRSGSVVMPLHHPVRVAEEWAVIDNLSNGRVGVAFASGWTMDEFILSAAPHAVRKDLMWQGIEQVHRLWQGEAVEFPDAAGNLVSAQTLPKPLQTTLPTWIACQSPGTFIEAGNRGFNILTSLLGETLEEVAPKIKLYRQALAENGYNPQQGKVTLMTHTFLGDSIEGVRQKVKQPFSEYLKNHYGLLENLAKGMGLSISIKDFSQDDMESLLEFGVEGFINGRSLIGTPTSCLPFVTELDNAGVNEIACLIDFVQDVDLVMESLRYLKQLRSNYQLALMDEILV
ncbi:MAG: LLM class flavin-dependent oxidoreductase [Cyanobacteria bacterium P01_F01_bin.143]